MTDRGAITRRIGSASALLAATGFTMTKVGTLSLGGSWGHEATIFVFVDDYVARLRAAGAAGKADTWRTWTEDCDGLRRFLREVRWRLTREPPMSLAGWQSLARWAERRAGLPDPARLPERAAERTPALSDGAFPRAALPKAPRGAHAAHEASPTRDSAGRGRKQSAIEAAPAFALPARGQGPDENDMARAELQARQGAGHGGDGGDAGLCAMTSSAPHAVLPARQEAWGTTATLVGGDGEGNETAGIEPVGHTVNPDISMLSLRPGAPDVRCARAAWARTGDEGEQGAGEAVPVLALPAHGQGPEERGVPAREDLAHGVEGEQGAEEAARALALPAHDQGLVEKALRTHHDEYHGGDEGGARTGQARPAGGGGLWPIRFRTLPPTRLAPPVRQSGRAMR